MRMNRLMGFCCGCMLVTAGFVGVVRAVAPDSAPVVTPDNTPPNFHDQALDAFGVGTADFQSLTIAEIPGQYMLTELNINGAPLTLEMFTHSVRSLNYQVRVQLADGSIEMREPGPVRTMRGSFLELTGSLAAGSMLDDGLYAMVIMPDGEKYWVEPIASKVPGAPADEHIIYQAADVTTPNGDCGTPDEVPAISGDGVATVQPEIRTQPDESGIINGMVDGNELFIAELACDADVQFRNIYGVAGAENRINAIINTLNIEYERDVEIRHEIVDIIIRTAEPDPYTSNDSNTLLSQFRAEWITNQAAISRDVAKLFTGRNINGTIIGQAWTIGGICPRSTAYCYSQDLGNFNCMTDLASHELGHLWNGIHCACNGTMRTPLGCFNQFVDSSVARILQHRDSRTCLQVIGVPPTNDDCSSAITIFNGSTNFTTELATTDGPTIDTCTGGGDNQVGSDVWFSYSATCDGDITVDLCGSTFDTKVAIYAGTCPSNPETAIACNDDFDCNGNSNPNDDGGASRVTFQGVLGTNYLIRIGGFQGDQGDVNMTISASGQVPSLPCCQTASDGTSCAGVDLSWGAAFGATNYIIFRDANGSTQTAQIVGETSSLNFTDTTANPEQVYTYWVRSENSCGIGNFPGGTTGFRSSGLPTAPTNVAASLGTNCDGVDVTWDAVAGVDNYAVYRSVDISFANAQLIGETADTSFEDAAAQQGAVFFYYVLAINECGSSLPGLPAAGTRGDFADVPEDVSASDGDACDRVTVSWTDVAGADSYQIFRNTVDNKNSATMVGMAPGTPFDDTTVAESTTYFYWVTSVNNCGASDFSAADQASTIACVGNLAGDMNCDGQVTVGDINGFVLALTDPQGYQDQFPDCDLLNADCSGDQQVTVGDINCFVGLVTGG